jgi:hypothetical protein
MRTQYWFTRECRGEPIHDTHSFFIVRRVYGLHPGARASLRTLSILEFFAKFDELLLQSQEAVCDWIGQIAVIHRGFGKAVSFHFNHAGRHAGDGRIGGHGFEDHRIGSYLYVVADSNAAENFRARSHHDMIPHGGMALTSVLTGPSQGHTLKERDVIADLGGFSDDDAHAVIDEKSFSNGRRGVDLDAGQDPSDLRNSPREEWNVMAMEPMRHAVGQERVKAGIGQNDFNRTRSRRVSIEHRSQILSNGGEHTEFSLS